MKHPACTPNIMDAPDDEIVCWCVNVTKGQVCDAISRGYTTLDRLHAELGILQGDRCSEKSPRGRCCCHEVVAMLMQSTLCCTKKKSAD